MKVLLTTGIFFPDVGGPATHVCKIAEYFASLGWKVTVVAFGNHSGPDMGGYKVIRISRKKGKLAAWFLYAFSVYRETLGHDVVYAFDLTTAGIPSALFSQMFRKPFILRIGGDPIWERMVEHGKRFLPMRAYYEQKFFKEDRPLLFRIIRMLVHSADSIVIYCDFLKEIYVQHYGIKEERITLIRNPFPQKHPATLEQGTFTFLFAGRFVSYKNLSRVLRVFSTLAAKHPDLRLVLIGDGPEEAALRKQAEPLGNKVEIIPKVDQKTLFERINRSSVALAPALTEFNPNFILEALALGKPALISRDNGLSADLPDSLEFDPMDDASLEAAMKRMLDPMHFEESLRFVADLDMSQSWDKVVAEHAKIVESRS